MYSILLKTKIGTFQITEVYKAFCSGPGNTSVGEDVLYAIRVNGEKLIVAETKSGRQVNGHLLELYDELVHSLTDMIFKDSVRPRVMDLTEDRFAWVNTSLVD